MTMGDGGGEEQRGTTRGNSGAGGGFDEGAFDGRVFDRDVFDGEAFEARPFDEREFDEPAFEERAFDGEAFDRQVFQQRSFYERAPDEHALQDGAFDRPASGGRAPDGRDVKARSSHRPPQRPAPARPDAARALKGAGLALGLAVVAGLGFGMLGGGDAAAQSGKAGAGAATTTETRSAAGTVTDDGTDDGADSDTPTGGSGDGTATADPAPLEVNPTDITADSLISRHQAAPRDPNKGPVTNLPLPRYVSLKGGEGNARRGPSLSHRIDWVFRHPGMPLRVVAEFGHWRRVEDQDGAGGWVHYSLLSGVRTAIVMTDMAELRTRSDQNATVIARAEAGAIVRLHECNKDWCRVSGGGEKGWVPKTSLWGVDAGEVRN